MTKTTRATKVTSEEIWDAIYADGKKPVDYVLLTEWYDQLFELGSNEQITNAEWDSIFAVRVAVSKQMEQLRKEKVIGSSLNADITVYASGDTYEALSKLKSELRFALITSEAKLVEADSQPSDTIVAEGEDIKNVWLSVNASSAEKCVRCWHQREDVGVNTDHPELCSRCVDNVTGDGEARYYA